MHEIPKIITASNLKHQNLDVVLADLEKEPLLLMSNNTPKAVLVNPTAWNNIVSRLKQLDNILAQIRLIEAKDNPNVLHPAERLGISHLQDADKVR